ncbi:MAG TPA: VOC family protein [Kofleriaceae bacterium]|nr:VOC family protein [Kofleriaceae bacterium]
MVINHINVIVKSLARSRPFFEDFLGLAPHSSLDGAYVTADGEPLLIALEFPHAKDPIPDDRHQFGRAVVFEVDSIAGVIRRCRDLGLQPVEQVGPGQERPLRGETPARLSVRDPDGNLWQFIEQQPLAATGATP